jgi:sortase A
MTGPAALEGSRESADSPVSPGSPVPSSSPVSPGSPVSSGSPAPAVPAARPASPAPEPAAAPVPIPVQAPVQAPVNGTAPAAPAATAARPPALTRPQVYRAVGAGLGLLGVFLLAFAGYLFGLSSVQESRSQSVMYTALSNELAAATAPVGPTTPGAPVAILDIPAIGVRDLVVVEGTSPENLMLGPGLVRNTPLPGQGGVAEIYGRRATFGAPFARLGQLRPGDLIRAITGQGVATYKVAALGGSSRLVRDSSANRLILLTAGSPVVPTYYSYADADLTSVVKPEPGGLPAIFSDETALSGDSTALVMTLLWGLALAGVSVAATVAAARWATWPTYLAAAPVVLIVLWNLYQSLAALLPNVY